MSSITVGVYLGKKDRLVRYWYEILPKGQFPMLVKYCMQSCLVRKKYFPLNTICDPRELEEQIKINVEYVPTQRNVTFTQDDGIVYKWVKDLGSGYRSEEIKNILYATVVHTLHPGKEVYMAQQELAPPAYGIITPRGNQKNMAAAYPAQGAPAAYAPEENLQMQNRQNVPNMQNVQHINSVNPENMRAEHAYSPWDKLPPQQAAVEPGEPTPHDKAKVHPEGHKSVYPMSMR